jgi:hypothetical protein
MSSAPAYLRVILLRHGQSENNRLMDDSFASYFSSRKPDAELTETGAQQARRAGQYVRALAAQSPVPLTRVFTSAMARALSTADAVCEALEGGEGEKEEGRGAAAASSPSSPLRAEVWVDICETGGLMQQRRPPPSSSSSSSSSSTAAAAAGSPTSSSSTAAILAAGPVGDDEWEGVPGLTPAEIAARFPRVRVGAGVPVPSHPRDAESAAGRTVTANSPGAGTKTYPASPFSPTGTAGFVTEGGWWLNAGKETEADGAARTARVVRALRCWAARLGGQEPPAAAPAPSALAELPAPAAFDNASAPAETGVDDARRVAVAAPSLDMAALQRRYGGGGGGAAAGGGITKHDGPARPRTIGVTPDGSDREHAGEAVVLVCHGDFIDHFIRAVVLQGGGEGDAAAAHHGGGGPPLQFCSNNCSVSILDLFPDGGARVVRLNDCRHLVPGGGMGGGGVGSDSLAGIATAVGPLLTGAPL